MKDQLLDLLRQVAEGKTSFNPKGDAIEDLEGFQRTVEDLMYLAELGYVGDCFTHREFKSGRGLYDLVQVRKGITDQGERFLKEGK